MCHLKYSMYVRCSLSYYKQLLKMIKYFCLDNASEELYPI